MTLTLERVQEEIEWMKQARPECDRCTRIHSDVAIGACEFHGIESAHAGKLERTKCGVQQVHAFMLARGYEYDSLADRYLKRCDDCARTLLYPWASRLHATRVLAFIKSDERCRDVGWDVELLRETIEESPSASVRRGFEFF